VQIDRDIFTINTEVTASMHLLSSTGV